MGSAKRSARRLSFAVAAALVLMDTSRMVAAGAPTDAAAADRATTDEARTASPGASPTTRPSDSFARDVDSAPLLVLPDFTPVHSAPSAASSDGGAAAGGPFAMISDHPGLSEDGSATHPSSAPAGDLTNLSLEDLMNVQVTSVSRHKEKAYDAPAAVSVITQEDIERSGMTTIPDLLRLAPGMDVGQLDGNKWAISSRGFNDVFGNKLLVLMDGRSIYTPAFGGVYWGHQDYVLQDLDQIEVVRGPGATLWGSNAVNGVISITTKSARDTQGWLIKGIGGSQTQQGAIRFGGRIDDDTYFRVYTKYRNFDDNEYPSGQSANDGWQSLQTGFRIDRYSSPNDTLTFQGDIYGDSLGQTDRVPILMAPYNIRHNESLTGDGGNLMARWTHRFSDTSDLTAQVYYDRLDEYEALYGMRQDTFDVDIQHRFQLAPRQELIWGLGYRFTQDRLSTTPALTSAPQDRDIQIVNVFVQDDITLIPDRLHAYVGTKVEYNTFTNAQVEPGARLLWTPDDRNTVWASVARATRTPTRLEEDTHLLFQALPTPQGPAEVVAVGNHGLGSEELTAYELGYRVRPISNLSLDLTAFYNAYDRLIGVETLSPSLAAAPAPHIVVPWLWSNNLRGDAYGAELSATWKVNDRWKLIGSYTFQEMQVLSDGSNNSYRQDFYNGASPQHQAQLRSYFNLTKNVDLNGALYYVGPLAAEHIPGYVRADAGVTWRPRENLELSFWVQNLFDDRHSEFPDTNAYTYRTEQTRSFFGELTWRF